VSRASGVRAIAVAASCVVAGVAAAGGVAATRAATVTIRVDARDFSFALSRRSVPAGTTVRFVVRNRGSVQHDFVIGAKRTRLLRHGGTQTLTVRFPRKGDIRFLCSIPGHAKLGMKGTFAVGKPASRKPVPKPPPPTVDVSSLVRPTEVANVGKPVFVTSPPGDTRRVFVVDQGGLVRVLVDGVLQEQPFLDIRERVQTVTETGLLGLAFAPDYATSRRFVVFFNQRKGNGDIAIVEMRASAGNPNRADVSTARTLVEVVKPWENHNAGMLQFGPDGYLYASVGDGDSGAQHKPGAFAQTRDDLLGNILRIDPSSGSPYAIPPDNPFVGIDGVRPEIWAYGLRNPWRFWIDAPTGDMYIGDVGLGAQEEIDIVPARTGGLNFGWPCFEGSQPFDATETCVDPVPPIVSIPHGAGDCSIIGGVVWRDPRIPALDGRYLFGDYCTGTVSTIVVQGGKVVDKDDLGVTVPVMSSFGVDGLGRVYVMSTAGGVYRLDPAATPAG
jgi:glucose/arabinose dehydrogenase